jgi:hypothetical protein
MRARPLADLVHARHAIAAVTTEVGDDVGPKLPLTGHQIDKALAGPQGRVDIARPQRQHDELAVVGAGDDQRQVLVG